MIPLPTTSISVLRVSAADGLRDAYDPRPAATTVTTGVPAHLSAPSAAEDRPGGTRQASTVTLLCDPTDLQHTDEVLDETTGQRYTVTTVLPRPDLFGLEHVTATLERTTGVGA